MGYARSRGMPVDTYTYRALWRKMGLFFQNIGLFGGNVCLCCRKYRALRDLRVNAGCLEDSYMYRAFWRKYKAFLLKCVAGLRKYMAFLWAKAGLYGM